MRLTLPVAGMTIGVYPARGLVIAEARGAAMLAGHSDDARLIPASKLGDAARRAVAAIESLGVALTAPVTVRRIDLAVELCFLVGAEGLAFLTACERALHLARLDMVPHYATGESRLESIVWQTPKGNATRIKLYDAGPHHRTHQPGKRLRLERECRWSGSVSPTPEHIKNLDLAALYRAPMRSWLNASIELEVSSPDAALALLYDQARRGERALRSAHMLGAKVNALARGDDMLTSKARKLRERELRDQGIVLDRSGDPSTRRIDLGTPLAALAAAWDASDEPVGPGGYAP